MKLYLTLCYMLACHHIPNRPVTKRLVIIAAGLINNPITAWIVVYMWDCSWRIESKHSTVSATHRCSLMDALCTPPGPTSGQHVCLVVDHTPQSLYLSAPWHKDISQVPHTARDISILCTWWWLLCPFHTAF